MVRCKFVMQLFASFAVTFSTFWQRDQIIYFVVISEHRVATHLENLENLEKSGNSKLVREKSGKMEKVREKSGKLKFAFWL